jgi:hypothetical protein
MNERLTQAEQEVVADEHAAELRERARQAVVDDNARAQADRDHQIAMEGFEAASRRARQRAAEADSAHTAHKTYWESVVAWWKGMTS